MFNVGDIITGTSSSPYSLTTNAALMVVVKLVSDRDMRVCLLAHEFYDVLGAWDCDKGFVVSNTDRYFEPTDSKLFLEQHKDCNIMTNDYLQRVCGEYHISLSMEDLVNGTKYESVIAEQKTEPKEKFVLSDEQRKELLEEMKKLLTEYGYSPTEEALNKILNEWARNKGDLIKILENHPNYNGKFQIVFDMDYERTVDVNEIRKFISTLYNDEVSKDKILQEVKGVSVFTYKECLNYYKHYYRLWDIMSDYSSTIKTLNGMTFDEVYEKKEKWRRLRDKYQSSGVELSNTIYTRESYSKYEKYVNVVDKLYYYRSCILDEELSNYINETFPEMKTKVGQKTSRVVNKFCKLFGIDKMPDYNKLFARYSDAINPLTIKRYTILSVHPVDYYTMSFGNSWASCHTIDRENVREMENAYHGQYSSGTESYMLDGTSMVFYTVDRNYEGNEFELQPKINRNMFHYGKEKLIQGRVYPQSNDGANDIYTKFREIVQKVMSECLNDTNSWLVVKGRSECRDVTSSYGTHYRDYVEYSSCNVSYHNKVKNYDRIVIGHDPICPCCGDIHGRKGCIECYDCNEGDDD